MAAKILTLLSSCALALAVSFSNPVIFNDLADIDLFRVGDDFYYSASSMHFSPGAPILTSKDLVNWEYLGFSVPSLDFNSPAYSLEDGMRAYARGVWASTLRFRASNRLWYWIGCVDFNATADTCLYDCGLLIDDDDKLYVTHGSTDLNVTQLTPDGLGIARNQQIYAADVYIEGSRMYKWNGVYYIITDQPDNGQYVLKSTAGPWGPYEFGVVLNNTLPPSALDGADTPHQGAFVDTPAGDWYYMAFVDVNGDSTGRVPVLSSISWNDDGWPVLLLDADNTWPESLPYPVDSGATTPNTDSSLTGVDTFASGTLGPQWEWNHNPNKAHFSVSRDGVYLSTASVTDDLYQAQNTLTHRTLGPASQATILLDYRGMADGDRAGLVMLRDSSAYIGISATGTDRTLVIRTGMTLNQTDNWSTISTGSDVATQPLQPSRSKCGARIYLRVAGDFGSSGTRQCQFSYSLDGVSFTSMGQNFTMANDWEFFQAYRFGIFNHATKALGGHVVLKQFALEAVPQ